MATHRVVLVVGHASGGIGVHVASLAARLPARGWQPSVVTAPDTAARFDFRAPVHPAWPGAGPRLLPAVRTLRRLCAEADVVHAHGHQAGILAILVTRTMRRSRRPKVAISWHNAVLGSGARRRLLGLMEGIQARQADLLTGASEDLVEDGRRRGARNVELAEVAAADIAAADPLTPDQRRAARSELRACGEGVLPTGAAASGDGPVILTVSRVAPQKNLRLAVDAGAALRATVPEALWIVVGDGDPELTTELERRRDELGAPVVFVGARDDVPRLMVTADVLALTSDWEARALVVQEAMALGLPVVATAVGGLPGLVGDAGVLVPPSDAPALARALHRVLTQPGVSEELSRLGRQAFALLPTESDVAGSWARRYEALLGTPPRRGRVTSR